MGSNFTVIKLGLGGVPPMLLVALNLADLAEEDGSFHQDNPDGVMYRGFNRKKLAGDLDRFGFSSIQVSTIHKIRRKNSQGDERPFPVFLMTAMKEKL